MLKRAWLAWSSGKDSAWALHVLRTHPDVDIVGLFTTLDKDTHRVAVHAVRDSLLGEQALAVGLPLHRIDIPYPCSNDAYAAAMERLVESARANGITHLAFGDLFLEDVRAYRIQIARVFPAHKWQAGSCAGGRCTGGGAASPCHGRLARCGETSSHSPVSRLRRRCGRSARLMRSSREKSRRSRL